MPRMPDVLDTDEFSLPELCAARLDGELIRVLGRWMPIDTPDLPAVRARVLGGRSTGPVIEGWSAAWVHGATPVPPRVAQFCVPHGARVARPRDPEVALREVSIAETDIVRVGGLRCTSGERTAYDLLRDPVLGPEVVEVIAALIDDGAVSAARLRERFAPERRVPHRRLALVRLSEAITRLASRTESSARIHDPTETSRR
ncbi:hypothetical protein ROT00_02310 [Agromyces mediolanus]|uniref:hypothetical protein n=1 Tax=Agromyces mediolanus TaxID=41986 RepID=UPI003835FF31